MENLVLQHLENGILCVTINQEKKLNALSAAIIQQLSNTLDQAATNTKVKAVIITGAGNKAFVAGADITEFLALNKAGGIQLAKEGQEKVFSKIENFPKPVLAAVNGFALGGGCELAMACHLRIASPNALFGQPEVKLGLIPGYGGTQRLAQLVGKGKAIEMLLTADMINAQQALDLRLVNHVVEADQLLPKANELLQKIIQRAAPLAVTRIIECVNAYYDKKQDGYAKELESFGSCFATHDFREGVAAFLEKRNPEFKGY
ncbi:MAG: enoyl-CoA hydratase-related protein [Chitinophagales bacterium]|nr:enoyl-CoA hydratase/isomerase family protein [Bacteroidota bacterium]MCB9043948.1 enoyl-CoA hydratase/isomerase family protein [Chitinophagales bacterium]